MTEGEAIHSDRDCGMDGRAAVPLMPIRLNGRSTTSHSRTSDLRLEGPGECREFAVWCQSGLRLRPVVMMGSAALPCMMPMMMLVVVRADGHDRSFASQRRQCERQCQGKNNQQTGHVHSPR